MAVTLVGSPSTNVSGSPLSSIAVTRNGIVAGNLIVVFVTATHSGGDITNVSDGTTTNSTPDVTSAVTSSRLSLYSFPNHTGGNFTFTASFSASQSPLAIAVIELQGAALTLPLDGTATGTGTGTSLSSGNLSPSPSVDGEYVIGAGVPGVLTTVGGSFADLWEEHAAYGFDVSGLAQSSHAAVAATWTTGSSNLWVAIAASYLPGGGVAAVLQPYSPTMVSA
jgi:hypothetical protein